MSNHTVLLNGKEYNYTPEDVTNIGLTPLGKHQYHLLDKSSNSKQITVVNIDLDAAKVELEIDGKSYITEIKLPIDNLIKELGLDVVAAAATDRVIAPMPGLVLDIIVSSGQSVNKGDNLLILEAMKMENVIKSPIDGVIKSIEVDKGNPISKSQVLVTYETD